MVLYADHETLIMCEGESLAIPINEINGIVFGSRDGDSCMDVLLVAPTSDLAYVDAEVQVVVNALHPDLLFGNNATVDAVMHALQAGEYDLVWFACHGTEEGLALADGRLSREELTQFLRGSSAAIFLNSCNSLGVAIDLHDELDVSVICSIVSVADEDAYHTGSLMAGHLAAGHDLRQAYDLSRPGRNRQFVFLNGTIQMSRHDRLDDLITMVHGLALRLSIIENSLDSMDQTSIKYSCSNPVSLLLGYVVFVSFIILLHSYVRTAFFLSSVATWIISVVLILAAGHLFMNGFGFSFSPQKKGDGL